MLIRVDSITDLGEERCVGFQCPAGGATALWRSDRFDPEVGESYHVEFDVDLLLRFGENARPSPREGYRIETDSQGIVLCGLVDGIDDDGVFYFRFGQDCLILVESDEGSLEVNSWVELRVRPQEFTVWPFQG